MMPTNRRTFLGAAGVLALSGRLASAAPSERVRVAVIGVRGRGADLARTFAGTEDAEVVALCDIDDEAFAKPVKAVEKIAGKAPGPRRISDACSTTRPSTRSRWRPPTTGMP